MRDTATKTCKKVKVLIGSKVVVEPGGYLLYGIRDEKDKARALEQWADEFREFVRDHRHQDVNDVSVEREYQEQCSACGGEWEECFFDEFEYGSDEKPFWGCANCGEPMEIVK